MIFQRKKDLLSKTWRFRLDVKGGSESSNGITFNQDLYDNNKFYNKIAGHIRKTDGYDKSLDKEEIDRKLIEIKEVYIANKEKYESISKKSGIPPELIAAIHYRENAKDYLAGTFGVYLHNGTPLGEESNIVPYPNYFEQEQFAEAAVDALTGKDNYFENRAAQLNLTSDSKDLTAMVTFTAFYNGWINDGNSSYTFNGTDIFSGGLYTSDHNYDSNAKDQNLGKYLVLERLLNQ